MELSSLQRYVQSFDSITNADELDLTQRSGLDQAPDFTRGPQDVQEVQHENIQADQQETLDNRAASRVSNIQYF